MRYEGCESYISKQNLIHARHQRHTPVILTMIYTLVFGPLSLGFWYEIWEESKVASLLKTIITIWLLIFKFSNVLLLLGYILEMKFSLNDLECVKEFTFTKVELISNV